MTIAIAPQIPMESVGISASLQSRRYIQNKIMMVCTVTSISNMLTKLIPSQILSTSSFTRAISSPVPVRSKNSALKDWIWRNRFFLMSDAMVDPR